LKLVENSGLGVLTSILAVCYAITMMISNNITRPVGGGFLRKKDRNSNLYQYHLKYPKMTHSALARIFKISRVRVTQILADEVQNASPQP